MKNFKLEIKKQDGSIYWVEYADGDDGGDRLQKWLDSEKAKSYWDPSYDAKILDVSPPPPTQAELDAIVADKLDQEQNRVALKGIKKADLVDVDKCAQAIMRIVKYLKADK